MGSFSTETAQQAQAVIQYIQPRITQPDWTAAGNIAMGEFFQLHLAGGKVTFRALVEIMNSDLTRKALEKVGNPNVLINVVSRRVRQLNSGGGSGRPLIEDYANLGAADIAMREIAEDKLSFELNSEAPVE